MKKQQKLKIAFFMYDLRVGGVGTVLMNTINALLASKNVEITLYSHRTIIEPVYIKWLEQHPQINVVIYYPWARFFDKQDHKKPIRRLLKRIGFGIYRKYRNFIMAPRVHTKHFDALIDYISGYSSKLIKHISGPMKLTWAHCSMNYFRENNFISGLSQYDKIVTISDSFLREFIKTYPTYANKAVRIYNPIDLKEMQKKLKSADIPNGKYFSCVSRLDSDKDIKTLLFAFDKFWQKENRPDVKLYIVGSGAKAQDFQNLAKTLQSAEQIIFTGNKQNPFGYMAGSMAHILSSYNEGLPTVLIEAMAANTLNISSNCPNGPHEILLDGRAGILFQPGDTDELAYALSDVYNKRVKIKNMTTVALKSLDRFSPQIIANEIINLISETK